MRIGERTLHQTTLSAKSKGAFSPSPGNSPAANAFTALQDNLLLYAARHKKKLSIEKGGWRHFRQHPAGSVFISGSSQPGPPDLRQILLNPKLNIGIVVDLREEVHFFLLDKAKKYHRITYTNRENWPFPGISFEKLEKKENQQLAKLLERMAYPKKIHLVYQREDGYVSSEKVKIQGLAVETEQAAIESLNLARKEEGLPPVQYYRVPITDKMPPKPKDIDRLIQIFKKGRDEGKNIHYHCMAGKGRTTTAMVLADIVSGIPLEEAIELEKSRFGRDLKSLPKENASDPLIVRGAALRLGILYRFQDYWNSPLRLSISFEEYMKRHPMDQGYEEQMAALLQVI